MRVAVPIVAGTAIRGIAATLMMRSVLQRHPEAFLITLANYGVTLPLHRSQDHLRHDINKGLLEQGHDSDTPLVLVGHSQGALAALRYAIDNPEQVAHVISVGCPWNGAVSASNVNRILGKRSHTLLPALSDMAVGSRWLQLLHRDLPGIASRVTNIYSTHEIFIRPYVDAHIDVAGVTNILVANEDEHRRHLQTHPELQVDDIILGNVNHMSEMNSPLVRAKIWERVEQVKSASARP